VFVPNCSLTFPGNCKPTIAHGKSGNKSSAPVRLNACRLRGRGEDLYRATFPLLERRERAVEPDCGGPGAGQADAAGGVKKALKLGNAGTGEHAAAGVSGLRATGLRDVLLARTVYRYVDHPRDDRARSVKNWFI
jgi:hypothetical protein